MHPIRKRRLISLTLSFTLLALAIGIALYALRQNISLYLTPSQVSEGLAPAGHHFRLGGMVKKGSVQYKQGRQSVEFIVTDFKHELTVRYRGLLPDLFREGQGIVSDGRLNKRGDFVASQVLAKHDETYMPPGMKSLPTKKQTI